MIYDTIAFIRKIIIKKIITNDLIEDLIEDNFEYYMIKYLNNKHPHCRCYYEEQ